MVLLEIVADAIVLAVLLRLAWSAARRCRRRREAKKDIARRLSDLSADE